LRRFLPVSSPGEDHANSSFQDWVGIADPDEPQEHRQKNFSQKSDLGKIGKQQEQFVRSQKEQRQKI
jgi:hypothetical protein